MAITKDREVYRDENGVVHDNRIIEDRHIVRDEPGGFGRGLTILVILILLVIAALFATGFLRADMKGGSLPDVSVKGGSLPKVDVDSKKVVVGTKTQEVEVPTVGVRDDSKK